MTKNRNNPPLVLVGTGKGGAGKTTISILLTLAFASAGHRVGIRDTDTQLSFTNCLGLPVFKDLPIAAAPRHGENEFDLVIADGPPSVDEPGFLADFDRCDVFCLVTRTGTLDLQTTATSYAALHARRPSAKIVLLVNAFAPRVVLDRELEANLGVCGLGDVPRLHSEIRDRELYRYVVFAGWDGAATAYRNRKSYDATQFFFAQAETAAVAKELYQIATKKS